MDGRKEGRVNGLVDGLIGGLMDRSIHGTTDGWAGAGIDARGFTHGGFKSYMCDRWSEGL